MLLYMSPHLLYMCADAGGPVGRACAGAGLQPRRRPRCLLHTHAHTQTHTHTHKHKHTHILAFSRDVDLGVSYIHVLILPYMCPHTATYVSSYCCMGVLILLYMCPHNAIYVSSYCYICVLILLYMCPHTAVYVSSCRRGIEPEIGRRASAWRPCRFLVCAS
jgi:hypothetical protein